LHVAFPKDEECGGGGRFAFVSKTTFNWRNFVLKYQFLQQTGERAIATGTSGTNMYGTEQQSSSVRT
jgi:hypothetical protein